MVNHAALVYKNLAKIGCQLFRTVNIQVQACIISVFRPVNADFVLLFQQVYIQ